AMVVVDQQGRIAMINKQTETMFGYHREELLGQSVEVIIPERFRGTHPAHRSAYSQSPNVRAMGVGVELSARRKDGSEFPVEISLSPLETAEGLLITAAVRNITERKQAEEQLRSRTEELSALFSLSTQLRQAGTAAEMYPIILREARQLLKADCGVIVSLDEHNSLFTIVFADGSMTSNMGRSFKLGKGISSIVLRTRQPYITSDYSNDPHHLTTMQNTDEVGPAVFVPLHSELELVGALMVGRQRSESAQPFSPAEVHLLTAIGEMVGNALRRVHLFEDAERRLKRTEALRAIDTAISSSTDLQFTLKTALDQVITELGVDAASVLLLNPSTLTLKYTIGHGFRSNAYSRTQVRLGEGQAGKAALDRQIVAHPDFTLNKPFFVMPELIVGENFSAYYAVPLIAKGFVKGVLEIFHRAPLHPDNEWLNFLETLGGQIAIAIDSATMFNDLHRSNIELKTAYDATIEGWSRALDLRDKETEGHTQRVTEMTMRLARAMGLGDEELMHIHRGALLHDMGKMGVPDGILLKPDKLTDEEWVRMKQHPQFAHDMLAPIPFLKSALDIPYCHHEKWDGTGYPRGLKGEQIPLAARIFAIVDVWDALRSDRPYRQGWSETKVREHIRANSGTHFDPQVVEAFMRMLDEK
ncbi:MAG: GAF domain-containing protein, partial [Chloroflexi bacterium]|nr:GAF domain-containing protein [Chloroflexota bacterium]